MLTEGDITLKPLEPADAEGIATLANDPDIFKNLRDIFPSPYTLGDAQAYIKLQQSKNPALSMGIYYKTQIIGVITLRPGEDVYRFSAEIGYWIGRPYWGKGIMTKAIKLMLHYGFDTLKLHRIFADVYSTNPPSMHVLEKCGFTLEGINKHAAFKLGEFVNTHKYAIVKS
jgi:ribosomal-protein-alanine N-acetyltransferase